MKPGRELDALIAEKILGCHPQRLKSDIRPGDDDFECSCCDLYFKHSDHLEPSRLKAYSTDIAAAWEVVGEVRKRGFEVYILGNPEYPWQCRIWNGDQDMGLKRAETPALAICLAALQTLGAQTDGANHPTSPPPDEL